MNILIIEDEYPAAEKLQQVLMDLDPTLEILSVIESVEQGIKWMQSHPAPDLIFSDIQLADGLSFEIFDQIPIDCPIIFTTAFDEYAIRAFKVKSIDYLLKPIKAVEVKTALDKFKSFSEMATTGSQQLKLREVLEILDNEKHRYKTRFLIRSKDQLMPVSTEDIAYFFTQNEVVYFYKNNGEKYAIDHKLEKLEAWLDPTHFFRINRQFLCRLPSIQRIHPYFNGRLKLILSPAAPKDVVVSRDKARAFKVWLGE